MNREGRRGSMARSPLVLGGLLLIALAGGATSGRAQQQGTFPHARHERLFPLCTGCHEGVVSGDSAAMFPSPQLCARCHDGQALQKVTWSGHSEPVTNLRFSHTMHVRMLRASGDSALDCEQCHSVPNAGRMAVTPKPQMNTCFGCHAHKATSHYVDAKCSTCHVPLARSGFQAAQIRRLPVPSDHRDSTFLIEGHGKAAESTSRCATCHTEERCLTCHVDASRREIQAMPKAPAGMELPPAKAHYPTPASHHEEGWLSVHGQQAGGGRCNTCHTRQDCLACHVGSVPAQVTALPSRRQTVAPGVGLKIHAPKSHASQFFMKVHPTLASSDNRSCETCHAESFCTDCHDGPSNGGYHPADYVMRHPADAFGQDAECSACHNTTVFCRDCHIESGLSTTGRLGGAYHTAEPLWLLRHGQAARQNLEACASCHKQRDCLQCHSVLGAFKISPHGADFDAARAWAKNPRMCLACHLKNPLDNGSQP